MACDEVKTCASNERMTFGEEPVQETVTLRRATAEDAAALAVVGAATFLEAYTWALPGADIVEFCTRFHTTAEYAKYLALPDTHITLAVTGQDAPVGYAMVCAPDFEGFELQPGDIELKRIYCLSKYRPGGVAKRMLEASEAAARTLGAKRILLGTNAGNQRAIRFYRKNGFEEAGSRSFTVGAQCCCDLVFAKTLETGK